MRASELVEAFADVRRRAVEKYLEGKEIAAERARAASARRTLALELVPVLCGSAFKNKGVQPLLDAVVDYLPSPLDVPPVEGVDPQAAEERGHPRADRRRAVRGARVQDHERPLRRPAHLPPRLLGTLEYGRPRLQRAPREASERVGRLLHMHAEQARGRSRRVAAGDIVAAVGLKHATPATRSATTSTRHPRAR